MESNAGQAHLTEDMSLNRRQFRLRGARRDKWSGAYRKDPPD